MPKFRITTEDPKGRARSTVSAPNEEAAAAEAQRGLADMSRDNLPDGERLNLKAKVENDSGNEVYRASLEFKAKWPEQIRRPDEESGAGG
jgi:hypothetical protein